MSNIDSPDVFFTFMKPIAEKIITILNSRGKPGLPPELILIQAAVETGWSTSGCNQGNPGWNGADNFSGLSYNGRINSYPNIDAYIQAYTQAISQSMYAGCFTEIHAAIAHLAQSDWRAYVPLEQRAAIALGKSPWAGSHYEATAGGAPGQTLENLLTQYGPYLATLFPPQLVQQIETPAATATTATTEEGSGDQDATVSVKSGETLSEIAAAHHESLSTLEAENPQITDPNLIHPGESVNVGEEPIKAKATAALVWKEAPAGPITTGATITLEPTKGINGLLAYVITAYIHE